MTTKTEIAATFPLCGGHLTFWRKRHVLRAYGELVPPSKLWAVLQRSGNENKIHSSEDLYRILVAQCCDLAAEIAPFCAPLAEQTAFLLGRFRAVTDAEFYNFLEDYHPVSLKEHLPRVEGHDFRFLIVDFSEGRSRPTTPGDIGPIDMSKSRLYEIVIDLRTGALRRESIYHTAQTESFLSLHICGGAFTGWRKIDAEDADGAAIPRYELWAVHRRDGIEIKIRSAEELYQVLRAQGCDLPAAVAPVVVGLAQLTAALLGRFRAATDVERDGDLKRVLDLSFSIRDELPRVDGSLFRFLVVDLSTPYRKDRLSGIDVDLRTGVITRQPRS